jgi:thioredoxin-like negative regulator of GroEL
MPTVKFLTTNDFNVSNRTLENSFVSGYSLILFHSSRCPHCKLAQEIVAHLSDTVVGCEFGMINLDDNKGVIRLAAQSNLKLEYVPLLVFFANGKAYMMYAGPLNEGNVRQFIEQVARAFAEEYSSSGDPNGRTLIDGVDGCALDDEVCKDDYVKRQRGCYVPMKEAYGGK